MRKKKPAKKDGPFSLARDWAYSCPYKVDEDAEEPDVYPPDSGAFIHAYNARAEARKKRFLKDASDYLLAVGRELERYGFRPAAAVSNPGGVAGSGDVWADYYPVSVPSPNDRYLHVNISESGVDTVGEAPPVGGRPTTLGFTTRRDRICVVARWHEPPPVGERGVARGRSPTTYGPNNWYDANLNSVQLATEIVRLLDIEPLPAAALTQTNLFDDLLAA